MELPIYSIAFTLILAFLITLAWGRFKSAQKLPPSPWNKLPIIGHLHHLVGLPPHHALRKLSQRYGALIHLKLGEISTVLVSSSLLAKEVFKIHDVAMANRAESLSGRIICYNCTNIACAPYGEYWRQMRKICTLELLSTKKVRSFGSIRLDEASHLITSIKALVGSAAPVDLTEKLAQYTSSMVVRAAFGKVSKNNHHSFLELVKESLPFSSTFEISDLFPSLKILHPLLSIKSELMKIHHKMDRLLDNIIDQHLDNLERLKLTHGGSGDEDLIDVLLRVKESGGLQLSITKNNIKAVALDIFTGGTETSSSTVEWAMAELIRNPHAMTKAKSEIRKAFRGKENIEEADIQELSYLKSVVKEALRLHPPVPLLVPRESREQCELDGYIIPVKTRVIVNAWAIGRDPEYWDDPESFRPERFENSAIDFTGSHFEYIPFGAGRRMCPGISFGLANVYLPLALLLYHFEWKLPDYLNPNDLSMAESVGITASRANHLVLLAKLYDSSP